MSGLPENPRGVLLARLCIRIWRMRVKLTKVLKSLRDDVPWKSVDDAVAVDPRGLKLDTGRRTNMSACLLFHAVCRLARCHRVLPKKLPYRLAARHLNIAADDEEARWYLDETIGHMSWLPVVRSGDDGDGGGAYGTADTRKDPFYIHIPMDPGRYWPHMIVAAVKADIFKELERELDGRLLHAVYYAYAIAYGSSEEEDPMGEFVKHAPFERAKDSKRTPREAAVAIMEETIRHAGVNFSRAWLSRMDACMDPPLRPFEAITLFDAFMEVFRVHKGTFEPAIARGIFDWFLEDDAKRIRSARGAWRKTVEASLLLDDGGLAVMGGAIRMKKRVRVEENEYEYAPYGP